MATITTKVQGKKINVNSTWSVYRYKPPHYKGRDSLRDLLAPLCDCEVYTRYGEYNGFGYERVGYDVRGISQDPKIAKKQKQRFVRAYHRVVRLMGPQKQKTKSYADKKNDWCKRLSRLTGINIEEAKKIAEEKEEYKESQIEELEERQAEHPSRKREVLINKIRRSNPLMHITSSEHAYAILSASNRHNNTDYQSRLEEGRELAEIGDIDKSEVRDYARHQL